MRDKWLDGGYAICKSGKKGASNWDCVLWGVFKVKFGHMTKPKSYSSIICFRTFKDLGLKILPEWIFLLKFWMFKVYPF